MMKVTAWQAGHHARVTGATFIRYSKRDRARHDIFFTKSYEWIMTEFQLSLFIMSSFCQGNHPKHGKRKHLKDAPLVLQMVVNLKSFLLPTLVLSIASSLFLMFSSTTILTEFSMIDNVAKERRGSRRHLIISKNLLPR